jgi:hypothetical protein
MRKLVDLFSLTAILGLPVLLAVLLPLLAAPRAAHAADSASMPGKEAFVALKCSVCHSIESLAIERKSKSEKTKGPDLSTIGTEHDQPWFKQWLTQQVENEHHKKHGKDFKGTPEQLEQITAFLASLKTK